LRAIVKGEVIFSALNTVCQRVQRPTVRARSSDQGETDAVIADSCVCCNSAIDAISAVEGEIGTVRTTRCKLDLLAGSAYSVVHCKVSAQLTAQIIIQERAIDAAVIHPCKTWTNIALYLVVG
jgi:hypothetical protein